jgi:hypothetical protein
MKKVTNGFVKSLHYLCLAGVIAIGLMTIVATGGGEDGGGEGGDYVVIVVDNLDGFPLYEESGLWAESLYAPVYNGSGRYTDEVGATATFTPDFPEAGTYEVYAWWNCWTGRDQFAKITITYDGGTDTIYRNQRADVDDVPLCPNPGDPASPCCGQWILLGSYPFAAGMAGSVTIERHDDPPDPSNGASTVADAVKFQMWVNS